MTTDKSAKYHKILILLEITPEFVIFSAQEQANKIIKDYNAFLENEKDQEVFFEAILNPQKPNNSLKIAASRFHEALNK